MQRTAGHAGYTINSRDIDVHDEEEFSRSFLNAKYTQHPRPKKKFKKIGLMQPR